MRKFFTLLWLLFPVGVVYYHFNEGQTQMAREKARDHLIRIRELERDLRIMGPINPLALQEFEALQERHEFLQQQLDDVFMPKECRVTQRRHAQRRIGSIHFGFLSVDEVGHLLVIASGAGFPDRHRALGGLVHAGCRREASDPMHQRNQRDRAEHQR
jgi:hypothetical protein